MRQQQSGNSDVLAELENLRRRVEALEAELAETERTRQSLREESSFRKAVIERAAEGVCVCHDILEYPYVRFTVWNNRMAEITGYDIDDINRLGWYQTVYPDAEIQEKARQRMERMRQGEDLHNERWEIRRADRQKRTVAISTSILTSDDGVTHVLALMHDITEEEIYRHSLEKKIRTLQELLPICASCKKIRDDKGYWHQVENYVRMHFEADFTHSICPECFKEMYPGISSRNRNS